MESKEIVKAKMRLNTILTKFSDDKVMQHIDLRSRKMTKPDKLRIWVNLLKSKKYFACAKRASIWLEYMA